ncbi:MAG: NAD(P)/FAD-dependent oxidoreductase [Acidimicrobiales bacterium]|jgi:NADH dehydrogenase
MLRARRFLSILLAGRLDGPAMGRASHRPRVVVIGAGFGGLAVCESLAKAEVEIVLVDRHNYNTFQPLLYQVATAGLNPGDIAYPIRAYTSLRRSVRFRRDEVASVDFSARSISFAEGPALGYDYLVLAAGAGTTYFGVSGAREHSKAIYTMEDAIAVRDIALASVERASSHGAREGDLTVVVVGGGPTGVEMAGALADLRKMEFGTRYAELDASLSRIVLVEQQERLLGAFHPKLSAYALRVLERRGVEVRCPESVKQVSSDRAVLGSGETIMCQLVIWAAGVGPCQLTDALELAKVRGRLEVDDDLRVTGFAEVFAIGDMAAARSDGQGPPLPQLAQQAIQEGRLVGEQIQRLISGGETRRFRYRDKGIMATIGRRAAVAELPRGIRLRGTTAWLAWLGLHIAVLTGVRNRTSVLLNWAWRYVSWRRGPRVIAGG